MSRIKSLYPFAQKWQEQGNIVLFSDPHWGDSDREFMGYNISEQEQCDKILAATRSGDTLVCLGDTGDASWMEYIKRNRNWRLHTVLIMGNHDRHSVVDKYFDEIYEGMLFISPQILLSHEPMAGEFYLNFHGHDHGARSPISATIPYKNEFFITGLNLAGNVCGFEPFKLNDYINNGGLKHIPTIHRTIIDTAITRKINRIASIGFIIKYMI